ncbi:MAG: thiamine diphosphokinase [Ruminococcaceae bacterium]|nr:thiamine diphosphokinase [Oscillospiraceae bacterium]
MAMRAFIFGGGEIYAELMDERPEGQDMVVCADGGYENAGKLGAHINLLVGDFDSIGSIPSDVDEIVQVPAKKDVTDVQLAVKCAIERGANDIIIVGSTDGRLDHTLSLIAVLEDLWDKKIPAHVVNGKNRVRYIRDSGVILVRSAYKYFSVVALDRRVKGVTIEGGEYPLVKKDIERGFQYAVSNEITKNAALINVKKGAVYVIESRDK